MAGIKKMKPSIICILIIVLLFLVFNQTRSGEHWWAGYTYEIDEYSNLSTTIVKMDNPTEKVVIPSSICFRDVKAIGGYATGYNLYGAERKGMFEDNNVVKEVVIPEGIESITNKCFINCTSLEKITLPGTIREFAFVGCTNLKTVVINNGNSKITSFSFLNCKSLKSFIVPDRIDRDSYVFNFENCSSLESVNNSDLFNYIFNYMFFNCKSLKSFTVSENVKSIGAHAFENCSSMESIVIKGNVVEISEDAFDGCDKLTIYGTKGSYAEQYANEHNIQFEELK